MNTGDNVHPELLIGVGGDELAPVSFRLPAGSVFTLLGGRSSGKTNALRALQHLNPAPGRWVCPEDGIDAEAFWKAALAQVKAGQVPKSAVLLADDADLLPAPAARDLADLHALGHAVILTANYNPLLFQRLPLALESRAGGQGILLSPSSAMEGDLFGVRFEVDPHPAAGRGVLISRGRASPFQVAWAGKH